MQLRTEHELTHTLCKKKKLFCNKRLLYIRYRKKEIQEEESEKLPAAS